jgi:SET domain-containing protein
METIATLDSPSGPDTSAEGEARRHRRFEIRSSRIQGRGGFALERFQANELIAEYKGSALTNEEAKGQLEAGNRYLFRVSETLTIDGKIHDNPAQFFNHACRPNCHSIIRGNRIWIAALREIEPGEELTFDYGYDIHEALPVPCVCGAPDCFRFILGEQHRWPVPPAAVD